MNGGPTTIGWTNARTQHVLCVRCAPQRSDLPDDEQDDSDQVLEDTDTGGHQLHCDRCHLPL